MLYSMTGYGRSKFSVFDKQFSLDLKSLNSKQLDLYMRSPFDLKEADIAFRKTISEQLIRGKVELTIVENKMTDAGVNINFSLLEKYVNQIQQFLNEKNIPQAELISPLLRHPDIIKTDIPQLSENENVILFESLKQAISEMMSFRKREGNELERDIVSRINIILQLLKDIDPHEANRIKRVREKLQNELLQIQLEADANRFEQELIYYLEKLDITEEKIRLKTHADYFLSFLNEPVIEKGKKLNFISQEIGREINTIGSKANSSDIQKIVIQMKDEMEKIKEQLNNVL